MSAAWPAAPPGVSQMTGAPAADTTATSSSGSISPCPKLSCRSRPESKSSLLSLACTRSTRPVIALIRSTASSRPMPPAQAWQVSRQNPTSWPSRASHSRAIASSRRAIAWSPPAVFSMSTGTFWSSRSNVLRQLSKPVAGSSAASTWPPCTISAAAPTSAARSTFCCSSLRDGIRIRLFVVATLIVYGEWTYSVTPAASAAARSAAAPPAYATEGPFQSCGSPRKNWTTSVPRAAASATGSSCSTWAPICSAVMSGSLGPVPWHGSTAADAFVTLLPRRARGRLVQRRWVTRMRHYELMVILDPELEERTVAPSLDQFLNVVRQGGGTVEKVDIWGRRRLAFEINKKTEGIYAVVDLTAEPATVKELDRQLNLNEAVLRTKVIRPDMR